MAHKTSSTSFWPFGSFGNCQGDPRWPNVAKVLFPLTSLHGPAAVPPLDLQISSQRLCTENHRNKVERLWSMDLYGPLWTFMDVWCDLIIFDPWDVGQPHPACIRLEKVRNSSSYLAASLKTSRYISRP